MASYPASGELFPLDPPSSLCLPSPTVLSQSLTNYYPCSALDPFTPARRAKYLHRILSSLKLPNTFKKLRPASERSNSTIKEDLKILDKPRVLNAKKATILAQIAAIILLLKRAFSFIVRTTCQIRKLYKSNSNLQSR